MRMIKTTQGLKIGDEFIYSGNHYKITKFHSRSIAVLELTKPLYSGMPDLMKVPISELKNHTQIGPDKSFLPDPNNKEPISVFVFDDLETLMETSTIVQTSEDNIYYNLPFWFKKRKGGGWDVFHLNDIPSDLRNYIEDVSMGRDKQQIDNRQYLKPKDLANE